MKGRASRMAERLRPWGGLIGGGLGAGLAHQIGSDSVFNDCQAASPGVVVAACLLGLLLIGGGAFASWTVWRDKGGPAPRRFIATISMMIAPLLAFAVLLSLSAALIIPPCHA
jgi:hypothetical protein